MIPKVSVETITEIGQKLASMAEQSYKTQNVNFFEREIKNIHEKQPYLLSWFALYCQACLQQGMLPQDIVAMQMVFFATLKALYTADEIGELDRLFGENKDEGDTKRKS